MREGDVIDQRYRVEKKLGQGGMGEVFRGHDDKLDRVVAIKALFPNTPDLVIKRFHTEAKALAALNHPNVMKILDFGQALDGQLYLVMDYVNGESLADLIEKRGVQTFFDVLPIFEKICRGLRFAHTNNVLHRDVKPSNVMLESDRTKEESVKLVDFGLAKLAAQDHELTTVGSAMGSPPYMSPEAVHGKKSDERSDIYSLGCTFFEMMVGQPPFVGDSPFHTMMAQVNRLAPALSEVSGKEYEEEVEEFIRKCIQKNPNDRFQNMDELIAELERVQAVLIEKRQSSMGYLASGAFASGNFAREQLRRLKLLKKLSIVSVIGLIVSSIVILEVVLQPFSQPEKKEAHAGALSDIAGAASDLHDEEEEDLRDKRVKYKRGATSFKDPGSPFQRCVLSGELTDDEVKTFVEPYRNSKVFVFDSLKVSDKSLSLLLQLPIAKLTIQRMQFSDSLSKGVGKMPNLLHFINISCGNLPKDTFVHLQKLPLQSLQVDVGKKYKNAGVHLSKLHKLNMLGIKNATMTRADIGSLATIPNLAMVGFVCCDFTDDALIDLKHAKKLIGFKIADTKLTQQQVAQIAELPNLTHLDLNKTNLTDDWLKELYNCKHLQEVTFTYTTVTEQGTALLKAHVPTLRKEGIRIGSGAPEVQLINDYQKN